MRKDTLAAGAKSAKFAGGVGENDINRNLMSEEDRAALEAETAKIVIEKAQAPKKVFRPLGTTILVRRLEPEKLSDILITETLEKEKPAEGTVLVVGKKVVDVVAGDQVVFGKYAGTEFKLNGETLLIMDEADIKGLLEPEMVKTIGGVPEAEISVGGCIVGRA